MIPKSEGRKNGMSRYDDVGIDVSRVVSSEGNAALAILSTLETKHTGVHSAATLLTSNVPSASNSRAILTLTKGSTPTARLELNRRVNAFEIIGGQPRDGACIKTGGAKGSRAGLASMTLPRVASRARPIASRRLRRRGRGRSRAIRKAHVKAGVPTPAI